MKVQNNLSINKQINFTNSSKMVEKIAKGFAKQGNIGEGASIACDFLGKAVVVPAVILATSKEPKETKEFSAFKNPVAACIQLAFEAPLLAVGSKAVGNLADKGFFDNVKGNKNGFSYNEKLQKELFLDTFEHLADKTPDIKNNSVDFIKGIKEKGYTKKAAEDLAEIINNADDGVKNALKTSFKNFENAHNNKFHLQNRVCFVAALLLTPLLCGIENYIHPKIMNKLYEKRGAKKPSHILKMPNMQHFINKTKNSKTQTGGLL